MQYKKPYFTIALAGLLLISFIGISVISYLITHESLRNQIAEESLPLTSDNIYSEIERDLLRSILISSLMAHDTFVRDWAIADNEDPEPIIRYLKEIRKRYDITTAFYISERSLKYYHPSGVLKTLNEEDEADQWYFRVRKMSDPYEINLDFDTADRSRLNIFINYRVTDFEGKFIGVTGIGLSVERVADLIENYQQRYNREIYFTDREGEVTVRGSHYQGPDRIQERSGMKRVVPRILANPSSSISYERPTGEQVYVNSRLVPELNWYLIVEQAESETDSRILGAMLINVIIALLITVLVLGIAWISFNRYRRQLEEMATTDKLTGTANRHLFELLFEHDLPAARRNNNPVSLLSLDIDNFKSINDSWGHDCGDAILRSFTEIVRDHIRSSDILCRWGGDEFLVLMNGLNSKEAEERAEIIRKSVDTHRFHCNRHPLDVTISIGITEYQDGETLEVLLQRVDNALYASKKQGRNRTTRT